jgi:hypothetical protein
MMRFYAILALFIFLFTHALADDSALLKRVEKAIKRAKNTVGNEAALAFEAAPLQQYKVLLAGNIAATPAELEIARKAITDQVIIVEQARNWYCPVMSVIPRAYKSILKLDGILDDVQWQTSGNYFGGYQLNSAVSDLPAKTEWRLTWDLNYLYIGIAAEDGTVEVNDGADIYLSADPDSSQILCIHVGLTGANSQTFYKKVKNQYGLQKIDSPEKFEIHAATAIYGAKSGYSMEVQIPITALIGKDKKIGTSTRAWMMMTRTDTDKKGALTYSWWPLLGGVGNTANYAPVWFDF